LIGNFTLAPAARAGFRSKFEPEQRLKFGVPKVQFSFKVVPGAPGLVSMLVIEA
jgi:hypothetical protein